MTTRILRKQLKEVAMATRRWILFLLTATLISALAGCGSGGTFNPQNPPAPPPPAQTLSIAFKTAPPASVQIGSTAQITAVVSNDPSNGGVSWALTCSVANNCGSLCPPKAINPPSNCSTTADTASGSPVTYYP